MWIPRFIRELVGEWKEVAEEKRKEKELQAYYDWYLNTLVDYYVEGWWMYNKDPSVTLDPSDREAVRRHIRWWSYSRKYLEFFVRNRRFEQAPMLGTSLDALGDSIRAAFAEAFPKAPKPLEWFIYKERGNWDDKAKEKIIDELF